MTHVPYSDSVFIRAKIVISLLYQEDDLTGQKVGANLISIFPVGSVRQIATI